jgi:xanthine phosphoribosyltransferase
MELLKQRILRDGRNLGNGILKVDGFINHQVDPVLMRACGEALANKFAHVGAQKIMTAEISGIAPAVMTGAFLGLPVVYARKKKPITMPAHVYHTQAPSHTKGVMVDLIVSSEFIHAGDRVLIIDDFLATGLTTEGLVRLVEQAHATLVGIGALVEKSFEGGRQLLEKYGVTIETLAIISDMSDGKIVFAP